MEQSAQPAEDDLVEVRVSGVRAAATDTPFLVLEDGRLGRELPIAIEPAEGNAIAFALQAVAMRRPMTHDALKQAVDALGGRLVRVVVGFQPDEHTFTADVVLLTDDGRERHLDWRVSDSVALAVRCDPVPPILVAEALFADAAGSPTAG